MKFRVRYTVPIAAVVFAAAFVFASLTGRQDAARKGPASGRIDQTREALPQSTVPVQFSEPRDRAHTGGDPHARLGPDQIVKVALQHLAEGRRGEAMLTLDSGISSFPKDPQLRGVRGSIHLQHQDFAKALSDFEAAIAEKPDDALLLVNRAQAYRSFDRIDEALVDLNKAINLLPDLVAARFNRGALYVTMGELEKAKADFEHSVAVDPHVAAPRFNLAITLDGLGRRGEAIAEMQHFLKVATQENWKKVAKEHPESRHPGKLEEGCQRANRGLAETKRNGQGRVGAAARSGGAVYG